MKRLKQTLLALAISMVSAGTMATNTISGNKQTSRTTVAASHLQRKPEHPQHQHRPNRHHSEIMNESDFQYLYDKVKSKPFDDDKLELLSVGVLSNHFTCRQCIKIMSVFTFDDKKLKVLDIMATHIEDKENYKKILDSLTFSSSRDKAKDMLRIPERHL